MIALLLCGGKGERLRPLTNNIPKPMVLIKNKPILWYIIKQIENLNLNKIYITVGYKSNVIKNYFFKNFIEKKIEIIDNGDVDIIERIKSIVLIEPNEEIVIIYGDTISNIIFNELFETAKKSNRFGTITVWPLTTNFGIVEFNSNLEVLEFKEKPKLDKWVNIGYFVMKPDLTKYLDKFSKFENFLEYAAKEGFLNVYKHEGAHITVNTILELENAEKNINKIFNYE
jgi:glucose-1-phosphate cytidylyltransferase